MTDKKISQLTAATTPLAGTEVLPIVQNGTTVKVSVNDLTNGKPVNSSDLTYTGTLTGSTGVINIGSGQLNKDASGNFGINTAAGTTKLVVNSNSATAYTGTTETAPDSAIWLANYNGGADTFTGINLRSIAGGTTQYAGIYGVKTAASSMAITFGTRNAGSYSEKIRISSDGNLVIGTSGKGIDFSATSEGTGTMTSELLSDYEEGTWTPVLSFGGGSTGITYSVQSGSYTKVGRLVTGRFIIVLTNKGSSTGATIIAGLPYIVNANWLGSSTTELASNFASAAPTQGYCGNDTNYIVPFVVTATGVTQTTDANFNNNTRLDMWFQYFV